MARVATDGRHHVSTTAGRRSKVATVGSYENLAGAELRSIDRASEGDQVDAKFLKNNPQ